ncbi:unnamed protein product [Acanthoscelides obtectus]|uniref:Annexin n=1 Tax=Acanthoscelides obtectus TaxID=200917 RepID=A0A9P0L9F8_ACAOB|nr:unnamed protein product [Acanthoscelides obtectus]CAK1622263.1 Annexin B11 [Acanthoscelides obtectus]
MAPTVIPCANFNDEADAEALKQAFRGFGTDEAAVIEIITKRSNAQRRQIAARFKTMYGKCLIKELKSELRGNFEDVIVALMTEPVEFLAKELHKAISGLGTEESTIVEILGIHNNDEIIRISNCYEGLYHRPLESDLKGDTAGTFKRLMVSLCNACRDESMAVNQEAARKDAQSLLRAGELKLGTDESTFNMILCQRNYAQLQLIFQEYQRLIGHDIEEAIKNEFSGDCEEGFLAVIRSIKNQPLFFARRLHKSMKGMGTNDQQLVRIVVTRCEVDMVQIKQEYQAKYESSLEDDLRADTSGTFKRMMVSLCTANRDEDPTVNLDQAREDAAKLAEAGELQMGTDESTFNSVLCARSYAHLRAVFEEYERLTGEYTYRSYLCIRILPSLSGLSLMLSPRFSPIRRTRQTYAAHSTRASFQLGNIFLMESEKLYV